MERDITLQINNGNSETVFVEDPQASRTFWNDYYTNSFEDEDEDYFLQSSIDLMGNPIKNSVERIKVRKKE